MRSHARFAKTDKGQEEIRNRTYRLQPKPRALLVIVDGKKAADELLQTATGFEANGFGDAYANLRKELSG